MGDQPVVEGQIPSMAKHGAGFGKERAGGIDEHVELIKMIRAGHDVHGHSPRIAGVFIYIHLSLTLEFVCL